MFGGVEIVSSLVISYYSQTGVAVTVDITKSARLSIRVFC